MQQTGIIRRVDELGRIVVPKEIRNNLKIKNGDCLEFFVENEKIVLIKHNAFKNIDSVQSLIDVVSKTLDVKLLITDDNKVLYASGLNCNGFEKQEISKNIYEIIFNRREYINSDKKNKIFDKYCCYIISPLIINGDVIGSIIFLKENEEIRNEEKLVIKIINKLLINNLEV